MPTEQDNRCFTLIELLVVVAIISILAAMLLPVLTKARQKAYGAACLGNMKQMALGMVSYTDENGGVLPRANVADIDPEHVGAPWVDTVGGGSKIYSWAELIASHMGVSDAAQEYTSTNIGHLAVLQHANTTAGAKLFACPGAGSQVTIHGHTDRSGKINYKGNALALSFKDGANPVTWQTIDRIDPGVIQIYDGINYQSSLYPKFDIAQTWGHYPNERHSSSANYLFIDGHVEASGTYADTVVDKQFPTKGTIWRSK